MRYYEKPKKPLRNWQMIKRVKIFREALSEMPEEFKRAMNIFRIVLVEQFCSRNNLSDREDISAFYVDAVLAELVIKQLLSFD
ncbi:MAG: hypothetical protein US55_C0031G0003 [Candidatus Levybacteria bacterium GW2011_GWC2_37_7]|nr:MAG: hypothetical protein US55_C0031G0003 [Candidatus Levybacteria bacterium GW2011_GWC2_37_7]